MDKRLLFPAIAMTAVAQQPSVPAVQSEAEKALRARAQQFYQLEVDKKYRQAMAMVAEDSQDYFFGAKPNILGFRIDKVELLDSDTHARITFTGKVTMMAPGLIGQTFEAQGVSTWRLESGEWFWYVDQTAMDTPFGKIVASNESDKSKVADITKMMSSGGPSVDSLMNQLTIDRTVVVLTNATPMQTVTISNHLPGPVMIEIQPTNIEGLTITQEAKELGAQQQMTVSFRAKAGSRPTGVVGIDAQPFGKHFNVMINWE